MPVVTAVLNGHREGLLAGMSIASFAEAIGEARGAGIEVQPIFLLDRPDALTRDVFAANPVAGGRTLVTDFGDPALARMHGAALGCGTYVTYLDADDLWSFNWITAATAMCEAAAVPFVAQSEMNWMFGGIHNFWIHADSTVDGFDPGYMTIGNYWDAMVFAWRQTVLDVPMEANAVKQGFGHEDWHWHTRLLLAGVAHRPVPGTIHMKRRRAGSQMALCEDNDVVPWPSDIYARARAHWAEAG